MGGRMIKKKKKETAQEREPTSPIGAWRGKD